MITVWSTGVGDEHDLAVGLSVRNPCGNIVELFAMYFISGCCLPHRFPSAAFSTTLPDLSYLGVHDMSKIWPLDYCALSPIAPGYGGKVCIYTGCDRVAAAWFITSYDFKPLCSHHLLVFPGYR